MTRLAAAVPDELVFDEEQRDFFESPYAIESVFAKNWGEAIRHDYV